MNKLELPDDTDRTVVMKNPIVSSQQLSELESESSGGRPAFQNAPMTAAGTELKQATPSRPSELNPESPSNVKRPKFRSTRETEAIVVRVLI